MKAVFLRALEAEDKATALRSAVCEQGVERRSQRFVLDPIDFATVPGSPFAYWISSNIRRLFVTSEPFETGARSARPGLMTTNDARFARAWFEVSPNRLGRRWFPFARGGTFSPFYSDIDTAVNWEHEGAEVKARIVEAYPYLNGNPGFVTNDTSFYFRPGLSWPLRAARFAPHAFPAGSIFSKRGYCAFIPEAQLAAGLAILNSSTFDYLFKIALGRHGYPEFVVGVLNRVPWPGLAHTDEAALGALARRAWSLKRGLDTRTETSHAFLLPALVQVDQESLTARSGALAKHVQEVEAELAAIHAEIDERCFALYSIDEEDRLSIAEGFGAGAGGSDGADVEAEKEADEEDEKAAETGAGRGALAAELLSWAVGVAFGRFDVRLATGDRPLPSEPEPFDPLPICSPGMLCGDDGLPLARPPSGYPLSFPADGVLVDDPGHQRDITAAVRAVFEAVFGPRADSLWQEAAALLDPRDHELRRWLASGFFEHHLRRHSKSRRKAPIFWQLGIPSGRYSVWCYAHRMTPDTLLSIQNDLVGPKLATQERRLSSLVTQAGQTPSASQRAEVASQQAFVDELRAMADEVRRVDLLWNPDLDDGIVLIMAPLWRLVTHKAWQKELRAKWGELVAGTYDWAHLAMYLWPERIVPKCAADRSLAIAHGLENVFWVETELGKWSARKVPTRPIAELVAERTSPAVKAGLAGLPKASMPVVGSTSWKRSGRA